MVQIHPVSPNVIVAKWITRLATDEEISGSNPLDDTKKESRMPGKVVHCKRDPYDIYIGRGSKWGNPFTHIPYGTQATWIVASREEAIARYEEWIRAQPELMEACKRELPGKTLGCYCVPLACHGEVLLKISEEKSDDQ